MAADAPFVVNTQTQKGNASTLVVTVPTGTASGHLLVAWQFDDDGTLANMSPPSGWATTSTVDNGTNNTHFKLYTKTATGSEGSSYTFNQNNGTDGVITVMAVANVDTNSAHWLVNSAATANSTSRVAASLGPPILGGGMLLCAACVDMNNTAVTFTPPSGMTEQSDLQSSTWAAQSVASMVAPPDPTGTRTFTISSSTQFGTALGIQSSLYLPPAVNEGQFFSMF